MFCARCGKEVPEGVGYCQSCGQEVGSAPTGVPARTAGPRPLPFAGFWVRLVAYFVDGLILGIPSAFVVLFILMSGTLGVTLHRGQVDPRQAAALLGPIMLVFFFVFLLFLVLQWMYFALMESSARQATVGKSLMSLRVTDSEGRRLSFGHATGRYFAKIISGMIPFGIGYIMAGFTAKKQALHDMIAGTLVMKA